MLAAGVGPNLPGNSATETGAASGTATRLRRVLCVGILAATVGRAAEPAKAVAAADPRQPFDLGKIVVVASRLGSRDWTSSVVEIGREDIEFAEARTAAEVLARVPGVFVRSGAEGEALVRMRGYRQREVKVLVDGVPINNPYHGRQDLRRIPASDVAAIRVLRGGTSVLYGPNAAGGVVEIITTRPAGDRPGAVMSGEGGADGYWRSTLFGTLPFGPAYLSLSLDAAERDGFPLSGGFHRDIGENGHTRENSDFRQATGTLKLGYEDDATRLGLSFTLDDTEYGLPARLPVTEFRRMEDLDTVRLAAIGERTLGSAAIARLSLHLNRTDSLQKGYDDNSFTTQDAVGSLTEEATDRLLGATASLHVDVGDRSRLSLAYGAQRSDRDASGFENRKAGGGNKGQGGVKTEPIDQSEDTWLHYLALEDEIDLASGLAFSAGLRLDDWHGPDHTSTLSWTLGLAWEPCQAVVVTPTVYRRTQFPLLRELYETGRGNPGLAAEKVTGTNLAVDLQLPHQWSLAGAVFYDRLDDLIDRDVNRVYQNIDKARYQGFEVGVTKQFGTKVTFTSTYAYVDAKDKSGDVANRDLRYRPRHKIDTSLTVALDGGFRGSVYHSYIGQQYVSGDNDDTIRASSVCGIAVSQRIYQQARLYARVDNLADTSYLDSDALPAPGRSALAGITVTF